MGWYFYFILAAFATPVQEASSGLAATVQKIADTERQLPWFWSSLLEGFGDIPYTFELKEARQALHSNGRPAAAGSTLQMEKIPLGGGSYYRCLMQNGASPCSETIVTALEKDSTRAAHFTDAEKAQSSAAREERRLRRRAFWTDFPAAFHFEFTGPGHMRFTPTGKYRAQRNPNTELLAKIKGELWFDPTTCEIVRMRYEMLDDAELIGRLYKGSTFEVTLSPMADKHRVPSKVSVRRKLPKGGYEDVETEFTNFRLFTSDSTIQFVDKDK
jgi:hypothetical protein